MRLLIDCYNLLHATMPPALAGLDEAGLCRLLAAGRFDEAVVVCDGVVKPDTPARSPVDGVELVYAGPGRTADAWIIDRLEADSAARRITVITDDRALRQSARSRGARVMSCREMIQRLLTLAGSHLPTPPTETDVAKHVGLDEIQVQRWKKELGLETDAEDL